MFVVHDDMTIYATRGDVVYFPVEKKQGDAKYKFQPEDVVRFKICEKKNYSKVVLMKDFLVEAETTSVNIFLDKHDMKFGEIINKPVDYWYEVELNPDTFPDTFIGYNADGPAVFKLFPETKDVVEGEIPDPEENSAVSRMVVTFVNEYMGENAETIVNEYITNYIQDHPIQNGKDGVGVAFASIDADGNLVLYYTDGSSAKVGRVVGYKGERGEVGETGATFTPRVDAEGNLSWTNDKGMENPAVVNIRGPKGETPVKGQDYMTDDDKTEIIEGLTYQKPDISGIAVTKANSVVLVKYSLSDGSTPSDSITLDSNGFPSTVVVNGVPFPVTWEGFDA